MLNESVLEWQQLKNGIFPVSNKILFVPHKISHLKLTHYSAVLLFYTPWKHLNTFRFSNIFRGYRKATPGCNGLNNLSFSGIRFYLTLATRSVKTGPIFYIWQVNLSLTALYISQKQNLFTFNKIVVDQIYKHEIINDRLNHVVRRRTLRI